MQIMITLSKITHRNEQRIRIDFAYDIAIKALVMQLPGCLWSKTHKCFHAPYHIDIYKKLQQLFGDRLIYMEKEKKLVLPLNFEPESTNATIPKQEKSFQKIETGSKNNAGISGKMVIIFTPILVDKVERIALTCNATYKTGMELLKGLPEAKWDACNRFWHIPLTKEACDYAVKMMGQNNLTPQTDLLKAHLIRRKLLKEGSPIPLSPETLAKKSLRYAGISTTNLSSLQAFTNHLMAKAYSQST